MEPDAELRIFVTELLTKAGFPPEDVVVRKTPEIWEVDANIPDAGLVIGEDGTHLGAWGQVLRAAARRIAGPGAPRVSFDVNQYRALKNETLREIARKAAREAALKKKPVELSPMNAYERRVVHSELALRPDVMTESTGEEPNRRIVVKPI